MLKKGYIILCIVSLLLCGCASEAGTKNPALPYVQRQETDMLPAPAAERNEGSMAFPPESDAEDVKFFYNHYIDVKGYESYKDATVLKAGLREKLLLYYDSQYVSESISEIKDILIFQVETIRQAEGEMTVLLLGIIADSLSIYPVLIVDRNGSIFYYFLTEHRTFNAELYVCDVTGDEYDELIVRIYAGIHSSGKYSIIYKMDARELIALFNDGYGESYYDTGFFLSEETGRIAIKNKYVSDMAPAYPDFDFELLKDYFEGCLSLDDVFGLGTGTFESFEPIDMDQDGVYEINATQSATIYEPHAARGIAYIGMVHTVLKYNGDTEKMEVIGAEFHTF